MFRPFIYFTMPWERKPRRSPLEESQWIRDTYRIRWDAYMAIRTGGSYSLGDPEMYKTVRKRLKKMFQNDEEKLSRFKLLKDEPRND